MSMLGAESSIYWRDVRVAQFIPTGLNFFSTVILLIGLLRIKRIVERYRRWKWKKDGLFAIHLVFFTLLTIMESVILAQMFKENGSTEAKANQDILLLDQVLYNLINFLATSFILYLLWLFSKSEWVRKVE